MDYLYISNWISENNNVVLVALNAVMIFVVIFGWFAVFWFGLRQNKKLMKNKAQMKIYEELYELRKAVDEKNLDLGLLLNPISLPFFKMKNIKYYPDIKSPYEAWNNYLQNLIKEIGLFTDAYRKLWTHIEMWIGVMQELEGMQKEFFEKWLGGLTDLLYKHHEYLVNLSRKNYKWEEWDYKDIEKHSEKMMECFDEIASAYLDDFMVEVHNCLVYPILEYKKEPRKNFNKTTNKYKILTKNGIKEIKKE